MEGPAASATQPPWRSCPARPVLSILTPCTSEGGGGSGGCWILGKWFCWLQKGIFLSQNAFFNQEHALYGRKIFFKIQDGPARRGAFPVGLDGKGWYWKCVRGLSAGEEKSPSSSMCIPIALATSVFWHQKVLNDSHHVKHWVINVYGRENVFFCQKYGLLYRRCIFNYAHAFFGQYIITLSSKTHSENFEKTHTYWLKFWDLGSVQRCVLWRSRR